VSLSFPASFEAKPGEPVELSVKCNNPRFPLLKVPIVQPPRATAKASVPPR
jgi:hypothetical protein